MIGSWAFRVIFVRLCLCFLHDFIDAPIVRGRSRSDPLARCRPQCRRSAHHKKGRHRDNCNTRPYGMDQSREKTGTEPPERNAKEGGWHLGEHMDRAWFRKSWEHHAP